MGKLESLLQRRPCHQEEARSVASGKIVPPHPTVAVLRATFVGLDDERNLEEVFSHRGAVMHVVPRFLWGSCNEIGIGGDFVRSKTQ